ncbi:hypothetical protein CBS101457_005880 [Exobasidium rhododendri]|nr:hypothetical protein CBS101457_005880 [Exobasidium rhododendri]
MKGWQMVGAGMNAMAAIDGFQVAEPRYSRDDETRENPSSELQPSAKIVWDPHALPGGVSRSVARAPEVQLGALLEEDSRELRSDEAEEGIETVEADDTEMAMEEGLETNVSFSNEETIRVEGYSEGATEETLDGQSRWAGDESEDADTSLATDGPTASTSQPLQQHTHRRSEEENLRLRHAASIDSLSSFADDEEIQLSDDVEEETDADLLRSVLQESKRVAEEEEAAYPAKSRKKRPPLPSDIQREQSRSRSSTPSRMSGNQSSSENDSPQMTRTSRRSSARNGKSINYTLPKLNTKMRKPDPAELIPAMEGEEKRRESDGGSFGDDSKEDNTPKRTLKGRNEAASTGNLREIRRQHQARKGQEDVEGQVRENYVDGTSSRSTHIAAGKQGRTTTSRRSSAGPQPSKDQGGEREDSNRGNLSDGDTTTSEKSSTWAPSAPLPYALWKNSPQSSSHSAFVSSKSAGNGTPIPRGNSGQNIKALKVANRIQKSNVHQPVFPTDGGKKGAVRTASNVSDASNGNGNISSKVLASSAKSNQPKAAVNFNGEPKRSSLHAAMTLEDVDQKSPTHYSHER